MTHKDESRKSGPKKVPAKDKNEELKVEEVEELEERIAPMRIFPTRKDSNL